ncbi:hypothetical protein GY45DRAFT_1365103 [Cubamyces sp. BRFM 1775]|nr:hypothetical protein GY45DRAFT_1365103 [Cubamyces sp. BRFM 1775]
MSTTSPTSSNYCSAGEEPLEPQRELQEAQITTMDIARLNKSIRSLAQHFTCVTTDLELLDRKTKRPILKLTTSRKWARLETVHARWQKLHHQFKELVKKSRAQAMVAYALLKQFDNVVTSQWTSDQDGLVSLKKEIDNFMEMLATKEQQASELREGFQSLVREINSIGLEVNRELRAAERQKNSLFEELSNTLHNLEQLKASFTSISDEFSAFKRACIMCISAVAFAAPTGTLWDPQVVDDRVHDALASKVKAELQREAIRLRVEIKKGETAVIQLERQQSVVQDRLPLLEDAEKEIQHLADNIDILSDVWNFIKVNMMELNALLTTVVAGDHLTSFFQSKLNITRRSHQKLSGILHAYASDSQT